MDKQVVLKKIGNECAKFRHQIKEPQSSVAKSTNYSVEVVSSFENGRNNNLFVFLWYVSNGLDLIPILDIMCEVE
jgi:predicted transcriptional regulator